MGNFSEMSYNGTTRAIMALLSLIVFAGFASAEGGGNSGGVFLPWPAVASITAVVGLLGTLLGIVRKGDIDRFTTEIKGVNNRLDRQDVALDKMEGKLDKLFVHNGGSDVRRDP